MVCFPRVQFCHCKKSSSLHRPGFGVDSALGSLLALAASCRTPPHFCPPPSLALIMGGKEQSEDDNLRVTLLSFGRFFFFFFGMSIWENRIFIFVVKHTCKFSFRVSSMTWDVVGQVNTPGTILRLTIVWDFINWSSASENLKFKQAQHVHIIYQWLLLRIWFFHCSFYDPRKTNSNNKSTWDEKELNYVIINGYPV